MHCKCLVLLHIHIVGCSFRPSAVMGLWQNQLWCMYTDTTLAILFYIIKMILPLWTMSVMFPLRQRVGGSCLLLCRATIIMINKITMISYIWIFVPAQPLLHSSMQLLQCLSSWDCDFSHRQWHHCIPLNLWLYQSRVTFLVHSKRLAMTLRPWEPPTYLQWECHAQNKVSNSYIICCNNISKVFI